MLGFIWVSSPWSFRSVGQTLCDITTFWGWIPIFPLVNIQKLLKMAIEIVDFPIKNGDFL